MTVRTGNGNSTTQLQNTGILRSAQNDDRIVGATRWVVGAR
ncbi:hypothetical protein RBB75_19295 [Tunturibacter empetritectus]|uniref:Uncharacterized protein n=1 Tax=Tunturiibacter empetritectus TaxID=3069691 RepID=A0AAU7ZDX9_9BACT